MAIRVYESAFLGGLPRVVEDTGNGFAVVRDVKIVGTKSRKGRVYSSAGLQAAAHLYEGCKVFFDHDSSQSAIQHGRSYGHLFGRFRNVRWSGDGLRGDLYYNAAHPMAESFSNWARNDPSAIGCSHDAEPTRISRMADGTPLVEGISQVSSVDIVASPATTKGLFEGENAMDELDMAGAGGAGDAITAPPPETGGGGDGAVGDGIMADAHMILDDASMPVMDRLKKLKSLLNMHAEITGDSSDPADESAAEPDGDEEPADDEEMKESLGKRAKRGDKVAARALARIEATEAKDRLEARRKQITSLYESYRIPAAARTAKLTEALVITSDDAAKAILESMASTSTVKAPASSQKAAVISPFATPAKAKPITEDERYRAFVADVTGR